MIVTSWMLAAVAFGVGFALLRYVKRRSHHIENMIECRERFFKAAHNLLSDNDTPEIVLERLEFMALHMDSPRIGRGFLFAALSGRLRDLAQNPPEDAQHALNAVRGMRAELRHQFAVASATSMLAATYTNIFIGPLLRRALTPLFLRGN